MSDKLRGGTTIGGYQAYHRGNLEVANLDADVITTGVIDAARLPEMSSVKGGDSTFAGNGTERTIAHGLGVIPLTVAATPTVNPGGYLGELWVRKDATNIYVGNSGSFVGAFSWSASK